MNLLYAMIMLQMLKVQMLKVQMPSHSRFQTERQG